MKYIKTYEFMNNNDIDFGYQGEDLEEYVDDICRPITDDWFDVSVKKIKTPSIKKVRGVTYDGSCVPYFHIKIYKYNYRKKEFQLFELGDIKDTVIHLIGSLNEEVGREYKYKIIIGGGDSDSEYNSIDEIKSVTGLTPNNNREMKFLQIEFTLK